MNYKPSPLCTGKPHPRYTLFPRSDKPDSNIGVCRICHSKHEYPQHFDAMFNPSHFPRERSGERIA